VRVDFGQGEHAVLFGMVSRRRNLFPKSDNNRSRRKTTYVGHNWSSYARTIEKQSRSWLQDVC
jgi:hypothetical protein